MVGTYRTVMTAALRHPNVKRITRRLLVDDDALDDPWRSTQSVSLLEGEGGTSPVTCGSKDACNQMEGETIRYCIAARKSMHLLVIE